MHDANSGPDRAKAARGVMGRAGARAGLVALGVVVALAVLLAHRPGGTTGAAAQSTGTSTSAPTSTAHQPRPKGASAWGIAYYGMDGRLHLAASDGTGDVAGPTVPAPAGYAHAADVSPDGRYLAYIEDVAPPAPSAIAVVDLRAAASGHAALTTIPFGIATHLYWSPDGTHLAVDTGMKGIHPLYVVDVHTGSRTLIPGTDNNPNGAGSPALPMVVGLLGWLDARHVVAVELPVGGPKAMPAPGATLAAAAARSGNGGGVAVSLDIATGAARPLVSDSTVYLTLLSADGSVGWAFGGSAGDPVRVVHLPSGGVRALPNSTQVAGSSWDVAALAPSGDTLAVPIVGTPGTPTTVDLISAATDSATPLPARGEPLAWSPDGRTLALLDSVPGWKQPDQPYTLSAFSPVSTEGSQVVLSAKVGAFFGFVRP